MYSKHYDNVYIFLFETEVGYWWSVVQNKIPVVDSYFFTYISI